MHDQTVHLRRLVCAFVVHKPPKIGLLSLRPIFDGSLLTLPEFLAAKKASRYEAFHFHHSDNLLLCFRYKTATRRTVEMSGKSTGDSERHGGRDAGILQKKSRVRNRVLSKSREAG